MMSGIPLKGMHECLGATQTHPIQVVSVVGHKHPWTLSINIQAITQGMVPGCFMIDIHYCPFCGRDLNVSDDEKLKTLFNETPQQ